MAENIIFNKTLSEWSKLIPAPELLDIMGKQDWARLLDWDEKIEKYRAMSKPKEKPMTREEAINKYKNAANTNKEYAAEYIAGLEALGLIKFEEEKKELSPSLVVCDVLKQKSNVFAPLSVAVHCVNALYEAGYQIVKKDAEIGMIGQKVRIKYQDSMGFNLQASGKLLCIEKT